MIVACWAHNPKVGGRFHRRNNIHPLPKRLREQSAKLLFVGSNPTRVSKGVVAQLVRALALQARGREFKSHQLHKIKEFGVAVVTLEFGSKGGGSIPSTSTNAVQVGSLTEIR